MASSENGSFLFDAGTQQKTINLNNTYVNNIVIKITPVNSNINIYLTDVQNNYFIVEKSSNESVTVNYIVIESDT